MSDAFHRFVNDWADRVWNADVATGRSALRELTVPACRFEGLGGDAEACVGADAYEPMWRMLRDGFPDIRCTVTDVVAGPEKNSDAGRLTGTAWFRLTGTHGGPFLGKPPTGRPIDVSGAASLWIEDGKLVRVRNAWDVMALLTQIGHAVESVRMAAAASGAD